MLFRFSAEKKRKRGSGAKLAGLKIRTTSISIADVADTRCALVFIERAFIIANIAAVSFIRKNNILKNFFIKSFVLSEFATSRFFILLLRFSRLF